MSNTSPQQSDTHPQKADMNELKKQAGIQAAEMVQDGMVVGLGTGSTAAHMIEHLALRMAREWIKIVGVSSSWSTTLQCRQLGIPLVDLGSVRKLDIVIDGADEIDPRRNLIKGRGAAHLLEKVTAALTDNYVIIADSSKKVQRLGELFPVPLEVLPAAYGLVCVRVEKLGGQVTPRKGAPGKDGPVISDSGNLICDAKFPVIPDAELLSSELDAIPGLLGHGLFVNMAQKVILATANGIETF
jgi:ribose 5-phosphate isomerase A